MGTRAAALKRWKKRGAKQRHSEVMKEACARVRRPTSLARAVARRPSEVNRMIDEMQANGIEVTECQPTPTKPSRGEMFSIVAFDATGGCSPPRYDSFASRAGLSVYAYYSKPLRDSSGIHVALVVGTRR